MMNKITKIYNKQDRPDTLNLSPKTKYSRRNIKRINSGDKLKKSKHEDSDLHISSQHNHNTPPSTAPNSNPQNIQNSQQQIASRSQLLLENIEQHVKNTKNLNEKLCLPISHLSHKLDAGLNLHLPSSVKEHVKDLTQNLPSLPSYHIKGSLNFSPKKKNTEYKSTTESSESDLNKSPLAKLSIKRKKSKHKKGKNLGTSLKKTLSNTETLYEKPNTEDEARRSSEPQILPLPESSELDTDYNKTPVGQKKLVHNLDSDIDEALDLPNSSENNQPHTNLNLQHNTALPSRTSHEMSNKIYPVDETKYLNINQHSESGFYSNSNSIELEYHKTAFADHSQYVEELIKKKEQDLALRLNLVMYLTFD